MEIKDIVKKYLKDLDRFKIKEIVNHKDFNDLEKWIIYYTYGEDRMVINTCAKLSISERQFHILRDLALVKLYYILKLNCTV